jgi:predicted cupin superfamily sugar epimerase
MDLELIIEKLALKNHPEGGFFAENYRAYEQIATGSLLGWKNDENPVRSVSTAIYYLLSGSDFSAFHKIKSDECWHFYYGTAFEIIEITPSGALIKTALGTDFKNGQVPQYVVRAGHWFGSRLLNPTDKKKYGLVGCTVAPGFDFKDFVMADRTNLSAEFPQHDMIIAEMTR